MFLKTVFANVFNLSDHAELIGNCRYFYVFYRAIVDGFSYFSRYFALSALMGVVGHMRMSFKPLFEQQLYACCQ